MPKEPFSDDSKKTLVHYAIEDPVVPCGDGSPAGFYTDAYTSSSIQSNQHIINFMGGGGCATKSSCEAIWDQQPYMFSSKFEPEAVEGHTFLSNDSTENPFMASFTKWNVPYCSQDLWLGNSNVADGWIRSGSVHVKAFLDHWLKEILEAGNGTSVDTLVIAGVSAGTMAILNHFEYMQNIAQGAGVKSLRFILDASLYSDKVDTNFTHLFNSIIDPNDHPLCLKDSTEHLQHDKLSRLPCCISTHCMLRHSDALSNFARETGNDPFKNQRLLLIDSAYDSLQTFLDLSSTFSLSNKLPASGFMSITGLSSTIFNIGEAGGNRKERMIETLFGGERQIGSNVVWVMPSATGHNVLIPSVELTTRLCQSGKQLEEEESSCDDQDCVFSEYPAGIYQVCNETGRGLRVPVGNDLSMTLWTTTESWKRIGVNGTSVQEIIAHFVGNSSYSQHSSSIMASCPGPVCVEEASVEGNPAQSLLEIENIFVSIPLWFQIIASIFVIAIPSLYVVTMLQRLSSIGRVKKEMFKSQNQNIFLKHLNVSSDAGAQILDNISLNLSSSTLNCLLGKSGSGKSTLLGVLSQQLRSNLRVEFEDGSDLANIPSTYMRQLDLVTLENMTPHDFLHSSAEVYGTSEERLKFVLGLTKDFFPYKTTQSEGSKENVLFDPFNNALIKECSGGQRRMLAISAALFQDTTFLLLDEPLSGLDSASSENIISMLKVIAKEHVVTVLMTLHQPSNEILLKMDKVMILGAGKIIFDGTFQIDSDERHSTKQQRPVSFVHNIISNGDDDFQQPSVRVENNELQTSEKYSQSMPRIWQIQPLLKRLHLECPPSLGDILTLPICFLVISVWGTIDSANPFQDFLMTSTFTLVPAILFQTRLVINWKMLVAHLWDLEDKRISRISYIFASGIYMFSIPIVSIVLSLILPFVAFGWPWEAFWIMNLYSIMVTISSLQIAKTLCVAMKSYEAVIGVYSTYIFISLILSGVFVNPSQVPNYLRWVMYLSMIFWGVSGSQLNMIEHADIGEDQCLSFVSCILQNRSYIADFTGFSSVTTSYLSIVALAAASTIFVILEYYFLDHKGSKSGMYEKRGGKITGAEDDAFGITELEDGSVRLSFGGSETLRSLPKDDNLMSFVKQSHTSINSNQNNESRAKCFASITESVDESYTSEGSK